MNTNIIYQGNAQDILPKIHSDTIDAIVSDPPYQLESITKRFGKKDSAIAQYGTDGAFQRVSKGFLGEKWDVLPNVEILKECLRVLKPGAFALWLMTPRQDSQLEFLMRLKEAGFDIGFTSLYWSFSSGFPKSENISKAIDKKLGYKREIISRNPNSRENSTIDNTIYKSGTVGKTAYITIPKSEQAKVLDNAYGGFQPKPAVEVIIVSMKPLSEKTYIDQALKNGKGITWLGNARIPDKVAGINNSRFPANLLVSDNILDVHIKKQGDFSKYFSLDSWWDMKIKELPEEIQKTYPFLITPKASKTEKNNMENQNIKNIHPTVKPLKLMSYLITLVSKPQDTILDPFIGSGTTMLSAKLLNRNCIGIEKIPEYIEIIKQRMNEGDRLNIVDKFEKEKNRNNEVIK
ncbi:MAG: site-specific DNA-methyltransferase [Thermoplasmata archaeon]